MKEVERGMPHVRSYVGEETLLYISEEISLDKCKSLTRTLVSRSQVALEAVHTLQSPLHFRVLLQQVCTRSTFSRLLAFEGVGLTRLHLYLRIR